MLTLFAHPSSGVVLVDVPLVPVEQPVHKGANSSSAADSLSRASNRVQIGVPQTLDIMLAWPESARLASEIASTVRQFDFYAVRLACSFLPDRSCRFVWARMMIDLVGRSMGSKPSSAAIVMDLFPRDVGVERKYKRAYSINPRLKYAFVEAAAELKSETEAVSYEPQLTAAGLLTGSPSWTFESTGRSGIAGSRELFMILKKPKGTDVQARFVVSADIQTLFGRIPCAVRGTPTRRANASASRPNDPSEGRSDYGMVLDSLVLV